jgi:hypothetical protein
MARSAVAPLLAVLLSVSCAALPPVVLETPEGTIRAPSDEDARRCAAALERLDPEVRSALGTRGPRPRIELYAERVAPGNMDGFITPDKIVLQGELGDPDEVLCHELVHWHATGKWTRLSYGLQQGLAYALTAVLTMPAERASRLHEVVLPEEGLIEGVLLLDLAAELAFADRRGLARTAAWIVLVLGLPQLERLAQRAESEGLATIPCAWIRLALPPPNTAVVLDRAWLRGLSATTVIERAPAPAER